MLENARTAPPWIAANEDDSRAFFGRRPLIAILARLDLALDDALVEDIQRGFDNDDAHDAFVGLLGMLSVVQGFAQKHHRRTTLFDASKVGCSGDPRILAVVRAALPGTASTLSGACSTSAPACATPACARDSTSPSSSS